MLQARELWSVLAYSRSFFESLFDELESLLDELESLFDEPESALDAPDSLLSLLSLFDAPESLPAIFEQASELLRSACRSGAPISVSERFAASEPLRSLAAPQRALSAFSEALRFGCEPGVFWLRALLLRSVFESLASGVLSLRPGRVFAGSEPVPAGRAERSDASRLVFAGLVFAGFVFGGLVVDALGCVRFASVAIARFGSVGVDASRPGCVVVPRAEASGAVLDASRLAGVVAERSVVVVLVAAAPVELRSVAEPLTVVLVRLISAAFKPKCV